MLTRSGGTERASLVCSLIVEMKGPNLGFCANIVASTFEMRQPAWPHQVCHLGQQNQGWKCPCIEDRWKGSGPPCRPGRPLPAGHPSGHGPARRRRCDPTGPARRAQLTPPSTSLYPSARGWASNPIPVRNSNGSSSGTGHPGALGVRSPEESMLHWAESHRWFVHAVELTVRPRINSATARSSGVVTFRFS